jgi:deoxyribodipyrimidine photo-lyase
MGGDEAMIPSRVRVVREGGAKKGPVAYWMSRDQRVKDNWALLYSQERALRGKQPLVVVFCLVPQFLHATIRQFAFMLKGLAEVEKDLARKDISFYLLRGQPEEEISFFLKKYGVSALITDFDPLRIKRAWKQKIAEVIDIPFHEVDAHNIVPCWIASEKQEYGAYTIRPKILTKLPAFLIPFPNLRKHPFLHERGGAAVDWQKIIKDMVVDESASEVSWLRPGEKAARGKLAVFVSRGLTEYAVQRNDPSRKGQSDLSPYLHFGQLSAQRVALAVLKSDNPKAAKDAFLEELIIRRELADNFCFYNRNYDDFNGFPAWAKQTLHDHRRDRREYLYSLEQFEQAETHDHLWNAAQLEMVKRGKMHGYMRMYWAKKILEWTVSPEAAMSIAVYLNDRYELDGRDPNGYAGIAWSIGGVHDRAWSERKIFGKIRYMSYNGCHAKFNVNAYIEAVKRLADR